MAKRLKDAFAPAATPRSIPKTAPPREPTPPAASRRGRTGITTFLTEEAHRQLRILSLDEKRSGQKLMVEALNDLFEKYGRPRIAD